MLGRLAQKASLSYIVSLYLIKEKHTNKIKKIPQNKVHFHINKRDQMSREFGWTTVGNGHTGRKGHFGS